MADWSIVNLTTAVVGIVTTTAFQVQSTADYSVSTTNGTISIVNESGSNFNILTNTTTAIPPKRPQTGQVFPRGVYNK